LDVLRRVGELLFDPRDVQEDAAVRTAAALFYLADDAPGDVIASEQFRRAAGVLVALGVAPALFGTVRGLILIVLRDVIEHEPFAVPVPQHAALTADAFGDQDASDAW